MPIRLQPSFFDIHERSAKLTQMGDPLVGLNEQIDWEAFRPSLNGVHEKVRKSRAGAKPIDVVLMFSIPSHLSSFSPPSSRSYRSDNYSDAGGLYSPTARRNRLARLGLRAPPALPVPRVSKALPVLPARLVWRRPVLRVPSVLLVRRACKALPARQVPRAGWWWAVPVKRALPAPRARKALPGRRALKVPALWDLPVLWVVPVLLACKV